MKKTLILAIILAAFAAAAQSPSTTTVQGTVYNAAGAPISGTLQLSWPAFTTSANQAIAAGRLTVSIGADGFLSVNLAPNMGASPAGLYYTAVYHLADGTTSTEYWVVPAAPQAALAAVRAQVMPAAQAVQAVNKAYVDQAIQQYATNQVSTFGGTLTGPLYLNGDPLIPTQAATKHYVDAQFAQALPSGGGIATGPLTATQLGAVYQADQSPGSDFTSKLQACINGLNSTYGGACDARNFTGSLTMSAPLTIATANVTVQFPCATIATAYPIVVAAGTRNVTLHGCATRGTSSASGSQGGTVFLYSGSAALFQVGDSTYAADTSGFHLDNVAINTTASTAATAQALAAWRTQELQLTSLYLLGNSTQTALTLDGTGNYTGGTFQDIQIGGFLTAVNAIGHQVSNPATTDWLNASTFVRLHIDCPTSGGNPIAGTTGINLQQGDGNTITGGDVEGCSTALHLGANAQNNTILGLRNENSTYQVMADPGSSYNNWMTGGTMFTGKLSDNGTRNSFLDTFHRSFNALNGDWYGSQQDATLTNHFRLGIGSGNERGLLNRYQTDYGYRWTTGLSDAAAGEQFYQVLDELNNVYRLSIGQYNNGQPSTNNQTVVNSAGSGAIVLNGSNNAGTGGVVFGSGGATSSTVATIDKSGNANFTGTLQVGGTSQSTGAITIRNNADAEVDYYLWPGFTSSQKGSFIYKDYNGNSQWYLVKDQNNNWALNSAIGGLDSFKAYQSTNSGDTYINASNSAGAVRVNYESGSGAAFNIYGGNSSTLYAAFTGPAAIKFPGLAASSGHNCVQIDNSGWITNTGSTCGAGTVGAGTAGQVAWYSASGTAVTGMAAVPLSAGGTGASSASAALANLGAVPASGGAMTGPLTGTTASFSGALAAGTSVAVGASGAVPQSCASAPTSDTNDAAAAIQAAANSALKNGQTLVLGGCYNVGSTITLGGYYDSVANVLYTGNVDLSGATFYVWNSPAIAIDVSVGPNATAPKWLPSTPYTLNTVASYGGNLYQVTSAGTSGTSGSVFSATSTPVTDGTVTWQWIGSSMLMNLNVRLPNLINMGKTGLGWPGQGIGVRAVNLHSSRVWSEHVQGFATGLWAAAYGYTGNDYNEYHLGWMDNNNTGLLLKSGDGVGWVNENTFYGGRFGINSSEGTQIAGTSFIDIDNSPTNCPNSNVFLKPSLESNQPQFQVINGCSDNSFIHARWEVTSPYNPQVLYNAALNQGGGNVIDRGDNASSIQITYCAPAWQASTAYALNSIVSSGPNIFIATVAGTSGSSLPAAFASPVPTPGTTTVTDGTVTWLNQAVGVTQCPATPDATFTNHLLADKIELHGLTNLVGLAYQQNNSAHAVFTFFNGLAPLGMQIAGNPNSWMAQIGAQGITGKQAADSPTSPRMTLNFSTGAAMVNSLQLLSGAGPTVTSGSGAPSGSCTSGSFYTNTAGAGNTTTYECVASAWQALAAVSSLPTVTQTWFTSPITGTASEPLSPGSANSVYGFGFVAPAGGLSFSKIHVLAQTTDAVNLYSVAIADSSGNLVCHPTTGAALGSLSATFACSEGTVTLNPGAVYIFLTTGTSTTAALYASSAQMVLPFQSTAVSGCTSSSGVIAGKCTISLAATHASAQVPVFSLGTL